MNISEMGLRRLAQWEGEIKDNGKHVAYDDAAGYLTIGIGHLLTEEELETGYILIRGILVDWNLDGLFDEEAFALLNQDLQWAQDAVNKNVKVFLLQNQFDSLASFVFNIGETNFRSSTLLRILNEANYIEVPNQLKRWNKADGKILRGLIIRRQHEIDQWNDLI